MNKQTPLPETEWDNSTIRAALDECYQKIGKDRILEMWEQRNMQANVTPTDPERQEMRKVWDTLPGSSCLMSVFYMLKRKAEQDN
jgi:hypothetical protein